MQPILSKPSSEQHQTLTTIQSIVLSPDFKRFYLWYVMHNFNLNCNTVKQKTLQGWWLINRMGDKALKNNAVVGQDGVADWIHHALLKPKYLRRRTESCIVKQALTNFFHICKKYMFLQFQQEGDSAKTKLFVLFLVLGQPYHQAP